VITLDTSGFWAATNRGDPFYSDARAVLAEDPGPWIIPAAILTEVAWIIEARSHARAIALDTLIDFLADLSSDQYSLSCGEQDFGRISELVRSYADLGLDFADAAVVACAERNGGRVLTTDRRHFHVVARGEKTITVWPA
jgi:predicted nucleic acid-binding protein